MLGATDDPCLPLARPAPKTASGGKIRARRFAPGKSAAKPLYHFRKSRFCGGTRVGHPILGSTIGRLVAAQIAGRAIGEAKDASASAGKKLYLAKNDAPRLPGQPDVQSDIVNGYGEDIVVNGYRNRDQAQAANQHYRWWDFLHVFGRVSDIAEPEDVEARQRAERFAAYNWPAAQAYRARAMTDPVVAATSARLDAQAQTIAIAQAAAQRQVTYGVVLAATGPAAAALGVVAAPASVPGFIAASGTEGAYIGSLTRGAGGGKITSSSIAIDAGVGVVGGLGGRYVVAPLAGNLVARFGPRLPEGQFSISDWGGYPANLPKPTGPFRLVDGAEYDAARIAANNANRAMHRADPTLSGFQIHEIQPVKFGGSPTDPLNKIPLTRTDHSAASVWWNQLQRSLGGK
jgi:hypothetical protein